MESGAILDSQISASSEYDSEYSSLYAATKGRLRLEASGESAGSWSAAFNDPNQWLQIDLLSQYTEVTSVATQGRNVYHQWVTKYKLQYSNDGVNFQYYREQGQNVDKEFDGNTDKDTVVYYVLKPPIRARYIRFRPVAWYYHISMRVELYECPKCQPALGMESGSILDSQITASSEHDSEYSSLYAATKGRLRSEASGESAGSWSAAFNDPNQWLQIDLLSQYTEVTSVATQGRNVYPQWVTKYKLQYSNDGVNFQYYREQGQNVAKEFDGNTDQNTVVYHVVKPPIRARYIRFRPVTWYAHISMRAELYGCVQECQEALGMESGLISDDKLSASSEYNADQAANRGRLHIQYSGGKTGGWVAATNDVNQWLQVDLGSQYTKVTRVATQGRSDYPHWVFNYKLQYSNNGVNFQNYRERGQNEDKEFAGNTDQDTVVYHVLNPPITARYIRFRPMAWYEHISMRVELYGCLQDSCRSLNFHSQVDGHALQGHVIKNISLSVGMRSSCRGRCTMESNCVSFNIGPPINDQVMCQLSDSDHTRHPEDLKPREGFTYRGTENACSSNPCFHNATCLNGFTYKKYRCVCKTGYRGENCESDNGGKNIKAMGYILVQ
ncbi:lactadherin-like isoform X1 [Oculina patagonica]